MNRRPAARRVATLLVAALLVDSMAFAVEPAPTPAPRQAERPPAVGWSIVGGLLTALVPMAIGGSMLARDTIPLQQGGIYVMQGGWALAPFVSHAIAGEWGRGALLSIPGLAAEAGMAGVFAYDPDVAAQGTPSSRVPFWILLGVSITGAAVGLGDSLLAGERWKTLHLTVAPVVGRAQSGLVLGGVF